jgi:hypothetical protein
MPDLKKLPFNFTMNINTQDGTTGEAGTTRYNLLYCHDGKF